MTNGCLGPWGRNSWPPTRQDVEASVAETSTYTFDLLWGSRMKMSEPLRDNLIGTTKEQGPVCSD